MYVKDMSDTDSAQVIEEVPPPAGELKEPKILLCGQCGEQKLKGHVHLKLVRPTGPPPQTRGDCLPGGSNAARPCVWITCKWWLYSQDEQTRGPVCVLDVADEGGMTLESVGVLMGITRERIRQIEEGFLKKLRKMDSLGQGKLRALLDEVNELDRE